MILLLLTLFSFSSFSQVEESCRALLTEANDSYLDASKTGALINFTYRALEGYECVEGSRIQFAELAEIVNRYDFRVKLAKDYALRVQRDYFDNICTFDDADEAEMIIEKLNNLILANAVLVRKARVAASCTGTLK